MMISLLSLSCLICQTDGAETACGGPARTEGSHEALVAAMAVFWLEKARSNLAGRSLWPVLPVCPPHPGAACRHGKMDNFVAETRAARPLQKPSPHSLSTAHLAFQEAANP